MRARLFATMIVATAFGVAGCGSAATTANTGPSDHTLVIGMINPFSGSDAAFGLDMNAGCVAAVQVINAHGGVLGHDFKCVPIDSKGDAADAVPAVTRALAVNTAMVGVIGPGTDAATATMPLLENAKLPTIGANGDVSFDQNKYHYYWRITPSDSANATAITVAAHNLGYKRAALVFGNDAGAQTNVPAILHAFPKLGGQIAVNVSLLPNQPSYQTEAAKIAASNADVIFTETDPQTAATIFSELKQMGKLVPILGTEPTIIPTWYKAVQGAVGAQDLQKYYEGVEQYAPAGPGYDAYNTALLADQGVDNPAQYSSSPFCKSYYDSVNLLALAMLKAKTANPPDYNNALLSVTTGSTKVLTFVDGAQALNQGKEIRYEGALGPVAFDQYHNSAGNFAVVSFSSSGAASDPITIITASQLKAAA